MDIDEKHEHMAKAWNEYNERFLLFWMKALSILEKENPDIDPRDEGWWPEINEKMEALGFKYQDIIDKYGVDIEHDELNITVSDWTGTDGDGCFAQTTDGKTMEIIAV